MARAAELLQIGYKSLEPAWPELAAGGLDFMFVDPANASMAIKAGMASTVICGYGRDSWSRTHSSEEARVKNQTTPDDQLPKEFATIGVVTATNLSECRFELVGFRI